MIAASMPYLVGYHHQGENWEFTGFVFGVEDGNSYIAKMLAGADGAWLFRTPYTTYPQNGAVVYLPYILLGKLSSVLGRHEQLVALYHWFRVLCGLLAIHATYDFISFFLVETHLRKLGITLATLGGGFGWLMPLLGKEEWLGSLPLEIYSPESFGFLSLYGIAHLALARAALFWGLTNYLKSVNRLEEVDFSHVVKLGGYWMLAALAQPLTAVVFGVVVGLHLFSLCLLKIWFWKRKNHLEWGRIFLMAKFVFFAGLIPAPFLVYNVWAFNNDPFLIAWTTQNIITSPHPLHYVLAYGIMVPLVYTGGKRLMTISAFSGLLPIIWVISLPLLAYFPSNFQRRMPEGIWVAIVVLALYSFQFDKSADRKNIIYWIPVFGMSFLSSLILLIGGILTASHPSQPAFRPKNEVMAFKFLSKNANSGDVVLATYSSSNALPAWASVHVIVGQGPESVGGSDLTPKVNSFFYKDVSEQERIIFLQEMGIDFVLWGPDERKHGGWDPNEAEYLVKVFQNSEFNLFLVANEND